MKILGARRDTSSERAKRRKIKVDILGRGRESLSVTPDNTVKDLRKSLSIPGNVRAVDSKGGTLTDSDKLKDREEVNFVPNVKGGF